MQQAIERAIKTMWDRYDERLSLDDVAREAILSRFYFTRVFREMTGTSPGRFLTAIRLYQAKQLLLETSLRVTTISYKVGYNSPGTFTSRFTRSVGVSPARYRLMSRAEWPLAPATGPSAPEPRGEGTPSAVVHGSLTMPESGVPLRVYVAAFDSPIVQGLPSSVNVLESAGHYRLTGIPAGRWYIKAAAVATGDVDPRPWARRPLFVGKTRAVTVRAGSNVELDLDMHCMCPFDLPILLALPELDSWNIPGVQQVVPPAAPEVTAEASAPQLLDTIPVPQPESPQTWADAPDEPLCAAGILDQLVKYRTLQAQLR